MPAHGTSSFYTWLGLQMRLVVLLCDGCWRRTVRTSRGWGGQEKDLTGQWPGLLAVLCQKWLWVGTATDPGIWKKTVSCLQAGLWGQYLDLGVSVDSEEAALARSHMCPQNRLLLQAVGCIFYFLLGPQPLPLQPYCRGWGAWLTLPLTWSCPAL